MSRGACDVHDRAHRKRNSAQATWKDEDCSYIQYTVGVKHLVGSTALCLASIYCTVAGNAGNKVINLSLCTQKSDPCLKDRQG